MKTYTELLRPIDGLIKLFQDDKVPISDVYANFCMLFRKYSSLTSITDIQRRFILSKISARFDFILSDCHLISYLLDPRYLGEEFPSLAKDRAEELIFEYHGLDSVAVLKEYTDFNIVVGRQKEMKKFKYQALLDGTKTVMQFWLTDGNSWPTLKTIATKVFSLVSSSAASERNFSTFGFIHSKLRNKLNPETVRKLVYIKCNSSQLEEAVNFESEDDSDDDNPENETMEE